MMCNDSNLKNHLDTLMAHTVNVTQKRLKQVVSGTFKEYLENDAIVKFRVEKCGETLEEV